MATNRLSIGVFFLPHYVFFYARKIIQKNTGDMHLKKYMSINKLSKQLIEFHIVRMGSTAFHI